MKDLFVQKESKLGVRLLRCFLVRTFRFLLFAWSVAPLRSILRRGADKQPTNLLVEEDGARSVVVLVFASEHVRTRATSCLS